MEVTDALYRISTAARARLNAILILGIFIGQVTGTALGTHLFLNYGFLTNADLNLGLMGFQARTRSLLTNPSQQKEWTTIPCVLTNISLTYSYSYSESVDPA